MSSFIRLKVGQVCDIRRGASPRPIDEWMSDKGIPWVKISDATKKDTRYIDFTEGFIKPEGARYSVCVAPGDLIISNSATPALPKIMRINACIHDGWLLASNFKSVTRDYLYYQIKYLQKYLINQGNGSIFKNLKTEILADFPITIPSDINNNPDIIIQGKIVNVLSKIEDKIDNNIEITISLESLAKTLYDYWFLQFEFPNENGKPYKSSGEKMVWNEELKREIPEGWKVSKIGDILEEANKSKIQVNDVKEKGKYPFFTSGEKILCYDDYLVKGFNIFLNTGGNPDIKAYMGKCAYSTDTWCVSAKEYSYILFYYLLKLMPQFEQLFFAGSGLKHLQKDSLKNQYILLPDEKVLRNFNNICELIWKKITNCIIENQELTALRDFLLPLLMNGQVSFNK